MRSSAKVRARRAEHGGEISLLKRTPHHQAAPLVSAACMPWGRGAQRVTPGAACAEVTAAISSEEMFAGASEGDRDAGDEASLSGMAYIEVLRYAPCLVPFEERARVFQDLIERDKQVGRPRLSSVFHRKVSARPVRCATPCVDPKQSHGRRCCRTCVQTRAWA